MGPTAVWEKWTLRLLVSAVLMLALGLDACGAQSTPPELAIATDSQVRTVYMTALIVGTMRGTVNGDGTACFRLVEGPHQLPMFWPKGYSARSNPLRVVDGHGKTVAVDGELVKLGGGTADLSKSQVILGCGEAKQVLVVG
jgi:hypothetical protein